MSRARILLVKLVLIVLIAGHLAVQIKQVEWWPYSRYPMYSTLFEPKIFVFEKLIAIKENGEEWAIPVYRYFRPFMDNNLMQSLSRHESLEKKAELLRALYSWYGRINTQDKPVIRGFRLYGYEYNFAEIKAQVEAGTFFTQTKINSSRKLVLEVIP